MALLLAEKGADIMDCHKLMRQDEYARNWVAGSVMSRYGATSLHATPTVVQ